MTGAGRPGWLPEQRIASIVSPHPQAALGGPSGGESIPTVGARSAGRFVCAVGYFLALAVVVTWPLVLHLGDSVVGQYGDNLYFIWIIGWVKHALLDLHVSPLFTYMLNYPQGWALASTEISPAQTLPALLFFPLGPTFGYNVVALLSFVLTGVFACVWVARRTGSIWAGVIAGTVVAVSPLRISHFLVGHLNLIGTQWVVLYFMSLYAALDPRNRSSAWCFLSGISLGLVGFTSMYYLYMSLVLTLVFVVGYAVLVCPGGLRHWWLWARLARTFGLALPLVLIAAFPSLDAAASGVLPLRRGEIITPYSASPTDYLLPFTGHPLWGDWIGAHFDRSYWIEASLYLGVVASLLAVFGSVTGLRSRSDRGTTFHLLLMVVAAFVLSLGSSLHWLSDPVTVHLPAWLHWLSAPDGQGLLLPGSLLDRYLPFYASMRVWMRYGFFVILFVAVLAGSGAAWLIRRSGPRLGSVLGAVFLGLCLLDFLPPTMSLTRVEGRPVDAWLRQQPATGAVAQFPFVEAADSQAQIFYTLVHMKPYIGSNYGSFATSQYNSVRFILEEFPNPESIRCLRDLGVRYVVVDDEWYDARDEMDDVHLALTRHGATRAVVLAGQHVYVLP